LVVTIPQFVASESALHALVEEVPQNTYRCDCHCCNGASHYASILIANYDPLYDEYCSAKDRARVKDLIYSGDTETLSHMEGWHQFLCLKCALFWTEMAVVSNRVYRHNLGIVLPGEIPYTRKSKKSRT